MIWDKILLMGNPNVGKSTIFSRLTGARVIISNYPGTTVEFTQGQIKIGSASPMVIDVPGTYTLDPTCKAEEVAVDILNSGGVAINVVDATNLERNLLLTLELLGKNIPMIVALNMWDEAKHKGIHIDVKKLEELLGVPVVPVCGLTGEGVKELIGRLPEATVPKFLIISSGRQWEAIGKIVESAQTLTHRHHTFLEILEDLTIKPLTGLPIAVVIIYCVFWSIRFIGENLISFVFTPLFEKLWLPLMVKLSVMLGQGSFVQHVLIGNFINGKIDFSQSFGLLTTGLFVPIAMVLPYIISFYLILGVLEDLGYLPRLAVLFDNFMHPLGLHGFAIIPMMLGFGCKVPGILAIRILEEKREKFIAATLIAIDIPCMAQMAMIVGLVGQRGGEHLVVVFSILFVLLILKGLILNKILKGISPEMLIDIPPYRIPHAKAVIKKLMMRLLEFLREALPLVLLGVFFVNILDALKVVDFLADIFAPIFISLWGLPKEVIGALVVGILRKDIAVGMLGPLALTTKQLIVSSILLTIYFPCIAVFMMLLRELGIKDGLRVILIMITITLLVGVLLNIIL